jgi:peptidoglycan/LPS O-acetylase OafA/YrhL
MTNQFNLHANYRADIDGLRALAILPVVVFHLGLEKLVPGGFIGVDIFFVISGYLIAQILLRDINAQRFSIATFYARRIRRIFPALFTVLTTCMVASLSFSFPSESKSLATTILSTLSFSSNILFFYTADYFSSAMERNPLLHTWSLSVEEQFYLFFPLLIFALRAASGRVRLAILSTLGLISFGISVWQVPNQPEAAFYLLPSRAWELLLGAILAEAKWQNPRRLVSEILAFIGAILIFASILLLNKATPFPGYAALGACLGAALLIHTGKPSSHQSPTLVSRLLALPPLRFIGLISYSLYLWHWPVIVFTKQVFGFDGKAIKLAVLVACFSLAILSWRFIERPFRSHYYRFSDRQTLQFGALAMVVMGGAAVLLPVLHTHLRPASPQAEAMLKLENNSQIHTMREGTCFLTSQFRDFEIFDQPTCLAMANSKKNVLILGESHAAHLWSGLQSTYPAINFLQATASGCKPVVNPTGEKRCTDLIHFMYNQWLPKQRYDAIILSARWRDEDQQKLLETAKILQQFTSHVIISGPIKEYDQSLPRLIANGLDTTQPLLALINEHEKKQIREIDKKLAALPWPAGAVYFSAYTTVQDSACTPFPVPGMPVQFDYGHLTHEGSRCVAKALGKLI